MGRRIFSVLFVLSITTVGQAQSADVDLLRAVPAQVVVSSAISPGLSGPSRMIDGRDDTAWCSRTGDLVGAWVLVSIPADASVTSIRLTPGFVTNDHGIAAWERNHRITRVAISRDGVSLGEHTLDPARAELQTIPIGAMGGVYRIEVRATLAGSVSSYGEACITNLEVRGRAGATVSTAGPEGRVATLRGDGHAASIVAHGAARTTLFDDPELYDEVAVGGAPEAERPFIALVQGSLVSNLRVHRVVARGPARGDHVLYVYYFWSPAAEDRMQERMAHHGRGAFRDEGCEDESAMCASMRLARISVPAHGVPVVDGDLEIGADVCAAAPRTLVRDLDADDIDELRVVLDWSTHPVCPVGFGDRSAELILDEQTLRVEYAGVPSTSSDHTDCSEDTRQIRRAADRNGDGHPDFEVRASATTGCASEHRTITTHTDRYLYDPVSDAWSLEPPP